MPNYAAIHDEVINDPLGIGYAAMSDVQACRMFRRRTA